MHYFYRTTWKKCCFSGDGEYICAGSARQHALYIWEKSIGNLVKILHGTKGELLLDVVWHPVRPIIASISSGLVSIWAQNQVENWSAFAPDFKELDENVEYEERESEFDIADEDKSVDLNADAQQDEEIEVDVQKVEPVAAFCSSDEDGEDENALQFLPMAPEVEDPEDGWTAQDSLDPSSNQIGTDSRDYEDDILTSKRRRMQHYDVSLPDAPTDGKFKADNFPEMLVILLLSCRNSPAYIQQSQQRQTTAHWWQKSCRPRQKISCRHCFYIISLYVSYDIKENINSSLRQWFPNLTREK